MRGNGGVDQIATQSPQAREGPFLVSSSEPAVAYNVGY
jgi:hypothetical protein